jgi:hypothetical protein
MKNKKYIITFAGAIGCSKTPIATYLSIKLNLPVFNNDSIRTEVSEDLGYFDEKEYLKRRDARLKNIWGQNRSFILDASIDRVWPDLREKLIKLNYNIFIISIDLSKPFLKKLYKIKGYHESLTRLDNVISDHKKLLATFPKDINLRINEKNFSKRLERSYRAIKNWIDK